MYIITKIFFNALLAEFIFLSEFAQQEHVPLKSRKIRFFKVFFFLSSFYATYLCER